ncbi:O-methyltransferase 1, chloroplastic [Gastrolobium bilobum]|uniref:O-methyltransferase 1, chloroplastic n=1 Tax=Gastrolobium bilobum TaxID=150636 RepID=UPI002AB0E7B8|nr:O-methyltransferase 1, chloroplastic [Gastrolobium bilobum]
MGPLIGTSIRRRFSVSAVKLNGDNDPLLLSATASASLRYQETLRPEPLFVDPYAGCFVPLNIPNDMSQDLHPYCLATKFIDDKLLRTVSHIDGLKQVVMLTDGMDTRPYRLNWPTSTIIFDISPEGVFKTAAEKLKGVGAKIPKSCIFYHIPLESSDIEQSLQSKGYNGSRPSIWAIQGFPVMTLANSEEVLSMISSLAMKGSFFVGELPAWLAETDIEIKYNTKQWIDKLFMSKGFRVELINYEGVAESLGKNFATGHCNNILFVAQQLRHSDYQMETWRREFQRVEAEGDEDGFDEL